MRLRSKVTAVSRLDNQQMLPETYSQIESANAAPRGVWLADPAEILDNDASTPQLYSPRE